jgi:glutamyl-tRNA reductase
VADVSAAEPWVLAVDAAETPVEDRARFQAEAEAMLEFHSGWGLLATCHRVEVYGMGPAPRWPDVMTLRGRPAARRLLRVAAGLESAVVGEDDVLHQVRDALAAARRRGVDERLARLFEVAIATGRKARAGRSQEGPGLAVRALAWLDGRAPLARQPVLVAGTGRMGTALARAATEAGAAVTVVGRDRSRASLDLVAGAAAAPRAAAVAVALAAPWEELGSLADRLPPVADLSSPPAVPEPVREALGGDFLGIDGLYARSGPQTPWAARAAALVEESADEYTSWLAGRGSVQTLRALQAEAEQRRLQRLERLLNRLPNLDQRERELISVMSEQLVTDLLHEPLSALRADSDGSGAEAARRLFRL